MEPALSGENKTNIQKRRRLSELYARGREARFNKDGAASFDVEKVDEDGNPKFIAGDEDFERTDDDIVIWVQPPSPLQREQALRESQAARSRALLAARKDETSPDSANTKAFVANMGQETLIDYVLSAEEQERRERAQRDVLGRDEWKEFSSLQDSMRQWDEAGNPRTEEWQPLIDKDIEFGRQVSKATKYLREADREALKMMSRDELERRAFEKRIELIGSQAFVQEYERQMVFYASRDGDDRALLFFEDVNDMMSQDELVQEVLSDTLASFIEDPAEAKNSPRAAHGSEQSELPEEPETSESSTPEEPSELTKSPGSSK
jgi:hypothetical protein